MTLPGPRILRATTAIAIALLLPSLGSPQESPPGAKKDKPEKEIPDAEKEIRREAEQVLGGIDLEVLTDGKWSKVARIEKPLLLYGDFTRENDRGSLWAWGEKGRPVALLELFQNVSDRTKWAYAVCNTSGGKLRAKRGGTPWWAENDSASELKNIPGAPVPAADALPRQRQMKLLAQKFTGHQFWDPDNTRYELRRIERPLQTYRDEANGVLEGGLFTLANGTNPEILLVIEARVDPKHKSKAVWQFATGRLAHAELHMEYDGKEIFSAPRGWELSAPTKPYWLGYFSTNAAEPGK